MLTNYQPHWFLGLSVGGLRGFTLYGGNFGHSYRTTFPLFEPFFKVEVGGEVADTTGTDQVASVYARWVIPRSHSEVYVEFGRSDHNWDATDFAFEPDHYRAYIAGFRKLIPFNPVCNEYLDVHMGNHLAADNTAAICSLLSTCKEAGVNPREWLIDVLTKLPYYQQPGYTIVLKELLPNYWQQTKVQ